MNIEEIKFLAEVQNFCRSPERLQLVIEAAVMGIKNQLTEEIHQRADMEVVANMAMHTRLFKGNEKFLAEKLERWQSRSAVKWDDVIEKLRSK